MIFLLALLFFQAPKPEPPKNLRAVVVRTPQPINVPAIWTKWKYPVQAWPQLCNDGDTLIMKGPEFTEYDYCEGAHWTCADPKRALLESVDGKHHWCHREEN